MVSSTSRVKDLSLFLYPTTTSRSMMKMAVPDHEMGFWLSLTKRSNW